MEIQPNRLLAILAHPDDESFAIGGTLAKYAQQGVQVVLLSATRGEAGIPGVELQEARAIHEHELRNAAQQLGIEVYFLDFQEGELARTNPQKLMEAISIWIDVVQPQVILTFGPDGVSGHPDHITISQIVTRAYDQFYKKGMLLYIHPSEATLLCCGVSSLTMEEDRPLVEVDISDYKFQKARAIQSHQSQTADLPSRPEEAIQRIPRKEIYTIARDRSKQTRQPAWFETQFETAIQ